MDIDLEARLRNGDYDRKACLAALHGQTLPYALGNPLHRLCVLRGIRYHHRFAEELRGTRPVFTRALNARSIMSGVVPERFDSPDEVPYCIWHPETASVETYRELARRHPQLRYNVARACAVAGYTDLYRELDVLPDVHVAEEARECGNLAIYDAIISQPVRYSIMNDYNLTVNPDEREPAWLNGDTAVHWMLNLKQKFEDASSDCHVCDPDNGEMISYDLFGGEGYRDQIFNITEDLHIDDFESDLTARRELASRAELTLLSESLPRDLPTVQKDVLIAMAAYYGDVDRYVRLRRPEMVGSEYQCCVRGIYHNTSFAVWWSKQPEKTRDTRIEEAIHARFIMNNVLSRLPCKPHVAPYLIWWPTIAEESTYQELAKLQPDMLPQIIHACICVGYDTLFDELLPRITPDTAMMSAARKRGNDYFEEQLEARLETLNASPVEVCSWKSKAPQAFGTSTTHVEKHLEALFMHNEYTWPGQYNTVHCDAAPVELITCLPDAWKLAADDEKRWRELDYEEWPRPLRADGDETGVARLDSN